MQTRTEYLSQLSQLDHMVKDMGDLVSSSLSQALQALWNSDKTLAGNIASQDDAIDNKERDIEHLCMTLLLRQQPVASDLRQVSSVMKLVSDLERIGDHSADIAEIVEHLDAGSYTPASLRKMAETVQNMVQEAVSAFVAHDTAKAAAVIARDDEADADFVAIRQDIAAHIVKHPADTDAALDSFMITKYLERIGDHAVNVAEWVSFCHDGEYKNGPLL